jgi:hypothetical protein
MAATAREWKGLGCGALVGAAIAFPAGVALSGRQSGSQESAAMRPSAAETPGSAGRRNFYSPNVMGDTFVPQRQQRLLKRWNEPAVHQVNYVSKPKAPGNIFARQKLWGSAGGDDWSRPLVTPKQIPQMSLDQACRPSIEKIRTQVESSFNLCRAAAPV